MSRMTRAGVAYLTLTLTAAVSILCTTLWLYLTYAKGVPETFSAAVVNTAATLAAATFVGVFDMFFTIQQLRQNEENQRQWRAEAQKERAEAQAEAQKERAEANARLERLLEDFRVGQEQAKVEREQAKVEREQAKVEREQNQQLIASLLTQNLELNARLLDLLERRNGNGSASAS